MPRPRRNPFDAVLGIAGVVFVITAASYCVTVLRGVRPAGTVSAGQSFDRLMTAHGTTALVVELVILAAATFLSIAVDELGGREVRRVLEQERERHAAAGGPPPAAEEAADGPAAPRHDRPPDHGGPPPGMRP